MLNESEIVKGTIKMDSVMSAFNQSDYKSFIPIGNSHYFLIIIVGILVFIILGISLYFLNRRLNLLHYIKEFFQEECAFCKKVIEKNKGVKETVNVEGTLIQRNLSFCSKDHLKSYLEKYGEPIGCCANCSYKFEKYSFEWWIFWIKIVAMSLFAIFILITSFNQ